MGSKSSKSPEPNSHLQGYSSDNKKYRPVYPHLVPDTQQHYQYPIYEHTQIPPHVTALPNHYNPGQVQNVSHVQGEYRIQQHTYPQPNNHGVVHSPTAPPLSLITQSNRQKAHTSIGSSKGSYQDESEATEKFKRLDRFLKCVLAEVPEHYSNKGYYCEACDDSFLKIRCRDKKDHTRNQSHLQRKTDAMAERHCPFCRVDLFCTDLLWKKHEESEIHKFWKEKCERNCGAVTEQSREYLKDFKGKTPYLVVTGFPERTRYRPLREFFYDFSKFARVEMRKEQDVEFARVFLNRRVALNIHESGFPLIFENRRLTTRVEWMV